MVLVTGGLGYIGSHSVISLINSGFEVIIVDDLSNSSLSVLDNINKITGKSIIFEKLNLCNGTLVNNLFDKYPKIDCIVHFAAFKSVSESVLNPLKYYKNNLYSLINILAQVEKKKIKHFIFSSSCTVYGESIKLPITEEESFKTPKSPYGYTKQIGERIIKDLVFKNTEIKSISLRYFNPIGAHESILIGENPLDKPQNLVPMITQTAIGKYPFLNIYGNDYKTRDGTCIRDYINVMDLADAHVSALSKLIKMNSSFYDVYNVGTGKGTSVIEVIDLFEKSNNLKLNYKFSDRRNGDVESAYASCDKINKELNWMAKYSLEDSLISAWNWECKINSKN